VALQILTQATLGFVNNFFILLTLQAFSGTLFKESRYRTMKAKNSLRESVICTAVFALIFSVITACGGGNIIPPIISGTQHATAAIRSFTHAGSSIGGSSTGHASVAALFATAPTASTLPESWQAGCADLSQNFTHLRYAILTTENGNLCGEGGNGVLTRDTPTATDYPDGPAVNFDGTITALVVTAQVEGIGEVRCNDVTNATAVANDSHLQPWFDTQTNAVLLTSQHVVIANTCTLPNIPAGAVIHKVVIKVAKS
jgi:hypothetical protein